MDDDPPIKQGLRIVSERLCPFMLSIIIMIIINYLIIVFILRSLHLCTHIETMLMYYFSYLLLFSYEGFALKHLNPSLQMI